MYFVISCSDKPGHSHVREETRPAHLAYLARYETALFAAGPTYAEDGVTMIGSLLILDLADREAAEAFARDDPYARAGLFDRVEIRPWKRVFPKT